MKRFAALVSGAILTGVFLVLGGAPAASTTEFTVSGTLGAQIFSTGRDLSVVIGPTAACFVDELWLMKKVGNTYVAARGAPLATNQDTGKVIALPRISAGEEIVFGMRVNAETSPCGPVASLRGREKRSDTMFVTGPKERNPDVFAHAKVQVAADGTATIGFEDIDRRLEVDQNSSITNAPNGCPSSSTPWTIARDFVKTNEDAPSTVQSTAPSPLGDYYDPQYGAYWDNYWYSPSRLTHLTESYPMTTPGARPAWCPDWNDMTFTLRGRQGGGGGGGGGTTTDCTFTIGYWKNHAGFGPQADALSPLLPVTLGTIGGTDSQTVTTASQAVTYLGYSGTSSNGIDKLYGQLLAAKLNIKSGADPTAVSATIASSDSFLATHLDASWASIGGAQQATVLGWVSVLDQYNNGLIGPGHCQ